MSKVYSFRLDENNPREAQAREVIEAWVEEGYSLRNMIVEALISYQNEGVRDRIPNALVEQLQDLILSFGKKPMSRNSKDTLSNSFLISVKEFVKPGTTSDHNLSSIKGKNNSIW